MDDEGYCPWCPIDGGPCIVCCSEGRPPADNKPNRVLAALFVIRVVVTAVLCVLVAVVLLKALIEGGK